MTKRNKKSAAHVVAHNADTVVLDSPAQEVVTQQVTAPEAPAQEEAKPAKAKSKRYASIAVLANPDAIITSVAPNPKKAGSKAFDKYALFEVGLSVKQIEEKFVANHWGRMKARNELRWDIEHGYVTLEAPQS